MIAREPRPRWMPSAPATRAGFEPGPDEDERRLSQSADEAL